MVVWHRGSGFACDPLRVAATKENRRHGLPGVAGEVGGVIGPTEAEILTEREESGHVGPCLPSAGGHERQSAPDCDESRPHSLLQALVA
jgi:hypothetical protein